MKVNGKPVGQQHQGIRPDEPEEIGQPRPKVYRAASRDDDVPSEIHPSVRESYRRRTYTPAAPREEGPAPVRASDRVERPDPEVQAGRALRRLRLSRGWSQEEAAKLMQVFGYDFHQTTIAKIEGAQRPLRVRELADFAALYGVEVQELIYAPSGSLEEAAREIAEVERQRTAAEERLRAAAADVESAEAVLHTARAAYQVSRRELAMLEERLDFLRRETGESGR